MSFLVQKDLCVCYKRWDRQAAMSVRIASPLQTCHMALSLCARWSSRLVVEHPTTSFTPHRWAIASTEWTTSSSHHQASSLTMSGMAEWWTVRQVTWIHDLTQQALSLHQWIFSPWNCSSIPKNCSCNQTFVLIPGFILYYNHTVCIQL